MKSYYYFPFPFIKENKAHCSSFRTTMLQLVRLQCKYFKIVYIINCDPGPILGPEQGFKV